MESNQPSAEQCLHMLLEQDAHPSDAQVDSLCEEYPKSAEDLRELVAAHRSACALLSSRRGDYSGGIAARESAKKSAFRVQAGAHVGDYRLLRFIARGGMGEVWEAEQLSLGRRIALKLILPERISHRGLGMFAREARAAGRLAHAGIASVYDAGEDEGLHWIAMEFVPGGMDLKGQLEALRSAEEIPDEYHGEVVRFVAQLADALEHAHEARVIHRDLKPQNILIAEDGRPKLTDFGLAKITDEADLSRTGDFAGTYFYMSPEQVAAKRMGIDHRTDIFSLGVLLYEMLSLRRPFEGDTVQQIAMKILTKEPPDLRSLRSRIPRDLAVIVQKSLEKDREKRFQTMAGFAADLRRHLRNEPIVARPPGLLERAWKWVHRHPGKSIGVVVALAAFLLISALWVSAQRNARDAEQQKRAAVLQRNSVLGLSAFRDLEQLESRAAELWPPHPEHRSDLQAWVDEAATLTASLDRGDGDYPGHRQMLATLEARALEPTGEERAADRLGHPRYPELADLNARLVQQQRAAAVYRGDADPEVYQLTETEAAMGPTQLNTLAWSLVRPSRAVVGEEARGLALARHGYESLGESVGHGALLHTIAWGLAGVGLDDQAREAAMRAPEEATEQNLEDTHRGQELLFEMLSQREAKLEETRAAIAELEDSLNERRAFTFADERDAWWRSQLVELIDRLEAFDHPLTGLAASAGDAIGPAAGWGVGRRLAFAEMLTERYAGAGEWAPRWNEARFAIKSSEAYHGLDLALQPGLVPIGPDPASGLHEFWHVATGEEPQRGDDGQLLLTEDSGVVLVLIPGTTFWMGAQGKDPEKPNYDPLAEVDEGPVHEVELSPYFISKYEMTQGQWLRVTAHNPSFYRPPQDYVRTLMHPVELVNWNDCMEWLPRAGLILPSEAQWECAARCGTNTPWWTGEDRSLLGDAGGINIADQAAARIGANWPGIADWPELDDGLVIHGPAGCTAPNLFGLHEMHGNVYEWCLDTYDGLYYRVCPRVNPVRTDPNIPHKAMRGGGFGSTSELTRVSHRVKPRSATNSDNGVGFRPARHVND